MAEPFSDEQLEAWIQKAHSAQSSLDLSAAEDLSIGLMNLISLEEHLYFSAMKTEDAAYLGMLDSVREMRKKVMQQLVTHPEGEEWCMSKHLLAASMRLIETGTKLRAQNKHDVAHFLFETAFHLYSLFFAINMPLQKQGSPEKSFVNHKAVHPIVQPKKSMMSTIAAIVKKAVDCCRE